MNPRLIYQPLYFLAILFINRGVHPSTLFRMNGLGMVSG